MPALPAAEARARFATARVARLATTGPARPHLVPVCFALDGDTLYTAVDAKPKRTQRLQRLTDVARNPAVSLLADHYDDDWSTLWWARLDGDARVLEPGGRGHARAVALLAARYAQYRDRPPEGAALAVDAVRWTGWQAST